MLPGEQEQRKKRILTRVCKGIGEKGDEGRIKERMAWMDCLTWEGRGNDAMKLECRGAIAPAKRVPNASVQIVSPQ